MMKKLEYLVRSHDYDERMSERERDGEMGLRRRRKKKSTTTKMKTLTKS